MIRTLFLLGKSDQRKETPTQSEMVEGGQINTVEFIGVLPLLPFVMTDRLLSEKSDIVMIGVNRIALPPNTRVNIFNLVADADASSAMLHEIQALANKVQPVRLFNPPHNVFKTSRAQLPKTLADIPGCVVPRVANADPGNIDELVAACTQFNRWPLILRARGLHGGEQMILLTEPGQLAGVKELPWLYTGICLIEYIDCRDENGLYQKNRVIVVNGVAYPRHAIVSDHWQIHMGSRAAVMDRERGLRDREAWMLASGLAPYAPVFQQIYERVGLDIFGIDFAVVDGQVVIFEANACMRFLDRKSGDDRYQYLDDHVKVLKRAIKKMLVQT